MLNFNITEDGYVCPHCGNSSMAAFLSSCCLTAQEEWNELLEDAYGPVEYLIIWPKSWGKPPQWLSLKPWPSTEQNK